MSKAQSIPTRVIDRLLGFVSGRLQATPEPVLPALPARNPASMMMDRSMATAWDRYIHGSSNRLAEVKFYEFLELEMAEVPKALDAYSTMCCTGTTTGTDRANFVVNIEDEAPQELKDRMEVIESVINRECFGIVRGMAQFGSFPAEIMVGEDGSVRRVTDLNHIPPGNMLRNAADTDGSKYWKRQYEGDAKAELMPQWKVPHFAIWTKMVTATKIRVYGDSMLRAVARLALQYGSCLDAVVIARLTRAAQRMGVKIDVSDIRGNDDAIIERLGKYQKFNERQRQVYRDGKQDSFQKAPVPDGDWYQPSGAGLEYDVKVLSGDPNVGKIEDIQFLMKCYLGALGVPPQYLGHSVESGGRSGLSQVDIQFSRSSRFLQMFACIAFEHVVAVDMILGGFDPDLYTWSVSPPSIGARDELLNAQIAMLRSQIVANLVNAGLEPSENPRWVLEILMNMGQEIKGLDDAMLGKLFKPLMAPGAKGTGTSRPDRTSAARESLGGEALRAVGEGTEEFLRNIREILEWTQPADLATPVTELVKPQRRLLRQHKLMPTTESLQRGILG